MKGAGQTPSGALNASRATGVGREPWFAAWRLCSTTSYAVLSSYNYRLASPAQRIELMVSGNLSVAPRPRYGATLLGGGVKGKVLA